MWLFSVNVSSITQGRIQKDSDHPNVPSYFLIKENDKEHILKFEGDILLDLSLIIMIQMGRQKISIWKLKETFCYKSTYFCSEDQTER